MKFSIVIPVYNVASYLCECLDSVLAQTFADWEAICVDDGSTDGSGAILDEYALKDKRIRVLHRENAGVSAARNVGLDCARGEYVTFLDGDDFYRPDWLIVAAAVVQRQSVDVIRLRLVNWIEGEALPPTKGRDAEPRFFIGSAAVRKWGWMTFMTGGWSVLLFVRRNAASGVGRVRFPVAMRNREDNIYTLRIAQVAASAAQAEYDGYVYRRRRGSAVLSVWPNADVVRFFDECRSLAQDWARGAGKSELTDEQKSLLSKTFWEFVHEWVSRPPIGNRAEVCRVCEKCREMIKSQLMYICDGSWTVGNFLFVTCKITLVMRLQLLIRKIYVWMRIGRWG